MIQYHFVTRFYGKARGGIGRYEENLFPLLRDTLDAEQLPIKPLPVPGLLHQLGSVLHMDLRAVAANHPCYLTQRSDGIVHLSNQTIALALLFLRQAHTVVTVHDIIPYIESTAGLRRNAAGNFWEWIIYMLNLRSLARADRIIVDSSHTKEDLVKYLNLAHEIIDVVPLGVDSTLYRQGPVPAEIYHRYGLSVHCKYLLYAGSQAPRKNLATLFSAMERLSTSRPDLQLLIAGPPKVDRREPNEQPKSGTVLNESVLFLGLVPENDLVHLYNLSKAFVFPSTYEGFGLPVLEAMACGCPVISSNATSLAEVVGDAGVLLDPHDVAAWVKTIKKLVHDRDQQELMRKAGLERARGMSWEKTAQATIEVYHKLDGTQRHSAN